MNPVCHFDDRHSNLRLSGSNGSCDWRKLRLVSTTALVMLAVAGSAALSSSASAATTQEELLHLLKEQSAELKKLKKEVETLKKQSAEKPVLTPALKKELARYEAGKSKTEKAADDSFVGTLLNRFVEKGTRPKSWRLPGTDVDISVNGFAKVDFIQRLKGETSGAEDLFATNAIVPDGLGRGTDARSRVHARESRLGVVLTKQTDFGLFKAQVEGDFFGPVSGSQLVSNSEVFRLRHAYGEIGPLTFGQTWGTFSDPGAIPETLDFEGPAGYTFIRQAQIRYTHTVSDGVTLAFAVENPDTRVVVNNVTGGGTTQVQTRDNNIPDFVVRGRIEKEWGSVQVGLLLRSISGENFGAAATTNPSINIPTGSGRGTDLGIAGSIHGKFFVPGSANQARKDFVGFQFLYGSGLGRYLQDTVGVSGEAAINPVTGRLETLTSYGGYFTYQHNWDEHFRTNLVFSGLRVDTPAYLNPNAYRGAFYAAGNLIWTPVKDLDLGVELQWGQRENADGRIGDALRFQTSAKFSF